MAGLLFDSWTETILADVLSLRIARFDLMGDTTELFETLRELPRPERARLAHRLIESLEPASDPADSEPAWSAELDDRLKAVDRGEFAEGTAADVIRRAREALSKEPN